MRVRKQQRQVKRAALEFLQQRLAQPAQAGAGVEDDEVMAAADFDASGVAAITHRVRAGAGMEPRTPQNLMCVAILMEAL